MKKIVLIFIVYFLIACNGQSTHIAPDYYFQGEFEPSMVDNVEAYIKKIAEENGYRVYEKRRDQMKALTDNQEAFFIALYRVDDKLPILTIGNVGIGKILTFDLYTNEDFSLEEAKELSEKINQYLKNELGVEMKPVDPNPPIKEKKQD